MKELIAEVDQRTRLAGCNRFEMLVFGLQGGLRFGINVFKVREVIRVPPLRRHPSAHPFVRGLAHVRGRTLPVIDLGVVLGLGEVPDGGYLVVTEFNRSVQGFLVDSVERIYNLNWEDVLPPPGGEGRTGLLTAVARVDGDVLEVLDVEKVLAEVIGNATGVSEATRREAQGRDIAGARVLVVDDSAVASNQLRRVLGQVGIAATFASDGVQALEMLEHWVCEGALDARVQLVISDIEMPRMDGYTLTTRIRGDAHLAHLKIMLHSSLSGGFNQAMVDKVRADYWLPKFSSDELVAQVLAALADDCPAPRWPVTES